MARIIGGVAVSHTPTIGFAVDRDKQADPVWAPIFEAMEPVKQWLAEVKPDVAIVTYNDHITSFFLDHYSAFALGVGERFEVADEGGGARDLPGIDGHPALAAHIGQSLMAEEFDMSFFQGKPLDHGCFSPLSVLWEHQHDWPVRIVPLQMGILQFPVPSARRFYKLGQALRRAIESYPQDLRVVIVATGGLSHQVHGERAGFNNTPWDMQFLELFENDPERLASLTHAELATLGGMEGAEVMMWLTMRGALSSQVRKLHQAYYLPSMTGIAAAVYENLAGPVIAGEVERHCQAMAVQLAGAERLQGSYPFNLQRSVKAFRLNTFLHGLIVPAQRQRYLADAATCMAEANLTAQECDLLQRRDWRGLVHYGVIFFLLEKLGAVVGVSNLHIYAAMRGETLEVFQQTRNAPNALYSVAGGNAQPAGWDAPAKP
jgi:gallate dioxygenase|nr:gallate dioxygenase [uncultured Albidiferax sp.]